MTNILIEESEVACGCYRNYFPSIVFSAAHDPSVRFYSCCVRRTVLETGILTKNGMKTVKDLQSPRGESYLRRGVKKYCILGPARRTSLAS